MNVYIWKACNNMTGNYHDEGGAVAIADSLAAARVELLRYAQKTGLNLGKESAALTAEPDIIYPLVGDAELYGEVFPDSGCC